MKQENFALIISSPSGAGKTSLAKAIISDDPQLVSSVSVTTRKKRSLEVEGKDYFFVDQDKFEEMITTDQFIEHARVFDNYYGSPKKFLIEQLNSGYDVVYDIDWQGAETLKTKLAKAVVSIFIFPPSMEELARRLRSRNQDSEEEIQKRLKIAQLEIAKYPLYDYSIINDCFEEALNKIKNIILTERIKRTNHSIFANKLLNN